MSVATTAIYPSPNVQLTNWPASASTANLLANGNPLLGSDSLSIAPSPPLISPNNVSTTHSPIKDTTPAKPHKSKPKASTVYLAAGLAGISITTFMWLVLPVFHELIAARQKKAFQDAVTASASTIHQKIVDMKSKYTDVMTHQLIHNFQTKGRATIPYNSSLEKLDTIKDDMPTALGLVREANEQRILVATALLEHLKAQPALNGFVQWNIDLLRKKIDKHFSIHDLGALHTAQKQAHTAFTQWADELYDASYKASGIAKRL